MRVRMQIRKRLLPRFLHACRELILFISSPRNYFYSNLTVRYRRWKECFVIGNAFSFLGTKSLSSSRAVTHTETML